MVTYRGVSVPIPREVVSVRGGGGERGRAPFIMIIVCPLYTLMFIVHAMGDEMARTLFILYTHG